MMGIAGSALSSVSAWCVAKKSDTQQPGSRRISNVGNTKANAKTLQFEVAPLMASAQISVDQVPQGSVSLVTVSTSEQAKVVGSFKGQVLPFFELTGSEPGHFGAILAVSHGQKVGPTKVRVTITKGVSKLHLKVPFTVVKGNFKTERLSVPSKRVTPRGKKTWARIIRETKEVKRLYKNVTHQSAWGGAFILPVDGDVTSPFGTRRLFNGKLKNFHPGVDLRAKTPLPIRATGGGQVVLAKDLFFTGNTIMLDHGYGVITLYAHLSQIQVKTGEIVQDGQVIGLTGKTGRVNGPHLHWQAVVHRTKIDPLGLVSLFPQSKDPEANDSKSSDVKPGDHNPAEHEIDSKESETDDFEGHSKPHEQPGHLGLIQTQSHALMLTQVHR